MQQLCDAEQCILHTVAVELCLDQSGGPSGGELFDENRPECTSECDSL